MFTYWVYSFGKMFAVKVKGRGAIMVHDFVLRFRTECSAPRHDGIEMSTQLFMAIDHPFRRKRRRLKKKEEEDSKKYSVKWANVYKLLDNELERLKETEGDRQTETDRKTLRQSDNYEDRLTNLKRT